MSLYKIAELYVDMDPSGKTLLAQAEKYKTSDNCKPDITIDKNDAEFKLWLKKYNEFSFNMNEYSWYGYCFYKNILNFDGLFFHSSSISYEGNGIVFSADKGTGKSTHSRLWLKAFSDKNIVIINDDKPVIRKTENGFYVYGTPFSGKTDANTNIGVPLKAICFLSRSQSCFIEKIDVNSALPLIFSQTLREKDINFMDSLISLIDGILKTVPVYNVGCNISSEAVLTVYNKLIKDKAVTI